MNVKFQAKESGCLSRIAQRFSDDLPICTRVLLKELFGTGLAKDTFVPVNTYLRYYVPADNSRM